MCSAGLLGFTDQVLTRLCAPERESKASHVKPSFFFLVLVLLLFFGTEWGEKHSTIHRPARVCSSTLEEVEAELKANEPPKNGPEAIGGA